MVFDEYHFRDNRVDADTDQQSEGGDALMQRGTDMQFLRDRARRSGSLFRVCCDERPGENRGHFITPNLDAGAVMTLSLNPVEIANVESLTFSWDVIRPTEVMAESLVKAKDPVEGGAQQSGLSLLDQRSLNAFAGDTALGRCD